MVYVHFPFCRSFCKYCGFYSELAAPGEDFVRAVCAEIESRRGEIEASAAVDTLYYGGGTPSVLPLEYLGRIADACGGRRWREWTVEVNPDDITPEYARGLKALGVNRVSMGVQSLDDGVLRWMGRRHDADGARRAFRFLRKAGFDNVSVDIIFGIDGFDFKVLEGTVMEILSWRPEHISAYQLSIDDDSELRQLNKAGKYNELDDDLCLEQYSFICSALAGAGYNHYEISNWARPGYRAVHNSAYWARVPYVGIGPAAHSLRQPSDGSASACAARTWNSDAISSWYSAGEDLTEREIWEERIMLGLRTADGIPSGLVYNRPPEDEDNYTPGEYIPDPQKYIDRLVPSLVHGNLRIPEDLWFIADDIISGIIA